MPSLSVSSGLTLSLAPRSGGGGVTPTPTPTPTPTAGAARTDFTSTGLTPAFQYHPNTELTTLSGGLITAVAANSNSPALTPSATGPQERTDRNGIKEWTFEGATYLDLPQSFVSTPRAMTVFIVGFAHGNRVINYFNPTFASDGVTVPNTLGAFLSQSLATNGISTLKTGNINTTSAASNKEKMIVGCQTCVFGVASRLTANGGARFFMNGETADTAQNPSTQANMQGGRIGGYAVSNGTTNMFTLKEIVCFLGELTNTQVAAVSAALLANWGVVPFTKNLILEGDSITQGVSDVTSADSLGVAVAQSGLVAADVRVINMGVSGATVATCVTRRDATNGWPIALLSGGAANNLLALQIGRNTASLTPAQQYDAIKAYHNDATTGVIARGFTPIQMANIACDPGPVTTTLHDLITANFATDVAGGIVVDLQQIRDSSNTPNFAPFVLGAPGVPYYQAGDNTHPSELGTRVMGTGGDTPQYGYGSLA